MSDELPEYLPRTARRSAGHRIRGLDYHVNEWGDPADPLLVMLHGWGDCGATFQFVVDALTRPWFVVAPDWRGFGRSFDAARGAPAYWFPDYLADLDALLGIYSPDAPARLAGHSMGGNVAGLYAGVMPERVAAFVNIEGFGLPDRDPSEAPDNYRRFIEAGRDPAPWTAYDSYAALAARLRKRNPGLPPDRALFVAKQWAEDDGEGTVRLRSDPAHRLPNAVLYRRAEAEACWARIIAPVLRVCGADSGFRAAAERWPRPDRPLGTPFEKPVETIRGAGHMVHLEQPAALAAAIESFL
jgi:pimeloyl-ACP methyl ester carboxylesterase